MMRSQDLRRKAGFTLTELLVVIAILALITVATIPVALNLFGDQEISTAASTVQAAFSLTRDSAVRSGRPVGLRLVPDPNFSNPNDRMASNRLLALESPSDYSEGYVIPVIEEFTYPALPGSPTVRRLAIYESRFDSDGLPSSPTSWYFNIRQGEVIRLETQNFTIAGPLTVGPAFGNPDRFVNETDNLQRPPAGNAITSLPFNPFFERLYVLNAQDDDTPNESSGNGYVDEAFDGIDNNSDSLIVSGFRKYIDSGFNGFDDDDGPDPSTSAGAVDDPKELIVYRDVFSGAQLYSDNSVTYDNSEYETEAAPDIFAYRRVNNAPYDPRTPVLLDADTGLPVTPIPIQYTIRRRPQPAPDAREVTLPASIVIDLTTTSNPLNGDRERSKVPLDPASGYVDLLIYPNGKIVPSTPFNNFTATADYPLYFLWLASREDVFEPLAYTVVPGGDNQCQLPMPRNTPRYTLPRVLEGQRRMVVLSPTSGHASVSTIEEFDGSDSQLPYGAATAGQQSGGATPQ